MSSKQKQSSLKGQKRPFWRKRQTSGSSASVTHKQLNGYKYSPSAAIPESTPKPWYPLIVTYTSTPREINAGNFYSGFLEQLDKDGVFIRPATTSGPPSGPYCLFRFQAVEVWNLTGRAVSLTVWELPEDSSIDNAGDSIDQLGGWTDAGGVDTFPRIGYRFPLGAAAQSHALNQVTDKTFKIITTTASSDKDMLVHRFHVLWRVPGPANYSATIPLSPSIQAVVSATKGATKMINTRSVQIQDLLIKILDKIPQPEGEELKVLLESFETLQVQDV